MFRSESNCQPCKARGTNVEVTEFIRVIPVRNRRPAYNSAVVMCVGHAAEVPEEGHVFETFAPAAL